MTSNPTAPEGSDEQTVSTTANEGRYDGSRRPLPDRGVPLPARARRVDDGSTLRKR